MSRCNCQNIYFMFWSTIFFYEKRKQLKIYIYISNHVRQICLFLQVTMTISSPNSTTLYHNKEYKATSCSLMLLLLKENGQRSCQGWQVFNTDAKILRGLKNKLKADKDSTRAFKKKRVFCLNWTKEKINKHCTIYWLVLITISWHVKDTF